MIIDLILDRKDDEQILKDDKYDAQEFYYNVLQYGEIGHNITYAMDYGANKDVRQALCTYITTNGYNPQICDYINRKEWIN